MRGVKQNIPTDIDTVMKGRDPLKRTTYVYSKVEAHNTDTDDLKLMTRREYVMKRFSLYRHRI